MKLNQLLTAVLLLLALYACQPDKGDAAQDNQSNRANGEQPPAEKETPNKLIEILIGEWELQNGGATAQQSKGSDRLRFTEEARYIAYSGGQKVDSGAYRMNEQLRNLYLESEVNEAPREFELDLQGDILTLTPKQQQQGEGGARRYKRVANRGQ